MFGTGLLNLAFAFICFFAFSSSVFAKDKVQTKNFEAQQLKILAKVFLQADAVHREFFRVTSGQAKSIMKSPFGKVHRALLSKAGEVLTAKGRFSCDKYLIKETIPVTFPRLVTVYENCNSKIAPLDLADLQWSSVSSVSVVFKGSNLTEVLGIGTSVVSKNFRCTLNFDERASLKSYRCEKWYEDKIATDVYEFSDYIYSNDADPTLQAKGVILRNLYPDRKIEVLVPKTGKILVRETVLNNPIKIAPTKPVVPMKALPRQKAGTGILPEPEYQNIEGEANGKNQQEKNRIESKGESEINQQGGQQEGLSEGIYQEGGQQESQQQEGNIKASPLEPRQVQPTSGESRP